MYAIVESGSKQYRVAVGDTLVVDHIEADEGSETTLPVLMLGGDEVKVGSPTVDGASVTAKVVDHHLGEKITTFKYKRRHRSRVRRGYRHSHTTLEITAIEG